MKILEKKEFIKFLKIISINLDKAEIKHEIPFCHIDKVEWNYINIIIPDIITQYDLVKILNMGETHEKYSIIYAKINDFDVRFIKTPEKLWSYTHYYYSWDILHVLMNVLVKTFKMSYDRTGLYYAYKDKKIKLTTNLKNIFGFFDLPFHLITNGFPTDYTIFSFIESSTYFNTKDFNMDVFKKLDYYFINNQKYYENFLEHMPGVEITEMSIEEMVVNIDAYFPESNFLEKLSKIKLREAFPNLKEKDIIFSAKKKERQNPKKEKNKNKKINLKKYFNFKKKDISNDDIEYGFED